MSWSEASLHRFIRELDGDDTHGRTTTGRGGSDAAVLDRGLVRPVLCVDQVVAGRHFTDAASPESVGYKAAARALSDLAATAATPRALLLTIRADDRSEQAESEAWMRAVIQSVWHAGRKFGAPLVGGDISAGDGPTSLSVSALGDFEFSGNPPGREHARVGDAVLLTGPVGGSLLGRHLSFEPRLSEGRWLYANGARTMMDVSDGLVLDLSRVAVSSRVAIELDLDRVPIHRDVQDMANKGGRSALDHALGDGEDHELIVITGEEQGALMLAQCSSEVPLLCRIGSVGEGAVGVWSRVGGEGVAMRLDDKSHGYLHGESH